VSLNDSILIGGVFKSAARMTKNDKDFSALDSVATTLQFPPQVHNPSKRRKVENFKDRKNGDTGEQSHQSTRLSQKFTESQRYVSHQWHNVGVLELEFDRSLILVFELEWNDFD
jgi:hypothetical protein